MSAIEKAAHIWERDPNDFYVEEEWCSARLFAEEHFANSIFWDKSHTGPWQGGWLHRDGVPA